MRAKQTVAFFAAVFVAFGFTGMPTSVADVPETSEMTGVVQDWNAAIRYMVVEGVRYEFGKDFVLLTEDGQPVPVDIVDAGARVRFWSQNGIVETVFLLNDGAQR